MHVAQMAYAQFQTYLADLPDVQLDPKAPRDTNIENFASTLIGWMKWVALIGGVLGLLISAGMLVVGRRNRNAMASDGMVGGVWVIGGVSLAAVAYGFVDAVWNIV